jgi:pyruvate formate lyase activating enzyme
MLITGYELLSLVDFPGRTAAVAFTHGCPWNCSYCHNRMLLHADAAPPNQEETFFRQLERRAGFLDGVVLCGGEPTIQDGLSTFFQRCRALGLATKLDTNGMRSKALKPLLKARLLDYVALDLKASPENYPTRTGATPGAVRRLGETLDVLRGSGVAYECRTTVAADVTLAELATHGLTFETRGLVLVNAG